MTGSFRGVQFRSLAEATLAELIANCEQRGVAVDLVPDGKSAFLRLIELIPPGADVTNGGSTTLKEIGFIDYLEQGKHGWRYRRAEILAEADKEKRERLRRAATTADYIVGSVNALALTGQAVCTDTGGTRVGAYCYGAGSVIWVVGTNKVVASLADALERVRSVAVPREDARTRAASGAASPMGKTLIFESEYFPGRVRLLLVDEALGY